MHVMFHVVFTIEHKETERLKHTDRERQRDKNTHFHKIKGDSVPYVYIFPLLGIRLTDFVMSQAVEICQIRTV